MTATYSATAATRLGPPHTPPKGIEFFRASRDAATGVSDAVASVVVASARAYEYFCNPYSRQEVEVRAAFRFLSQAWKRETQFQSSADIAEGNRNYQAIVALGAAVIPLILEELQDDPDFWFRALTEITGEDPIPAAHYGNLHAMTADWLEWGKQRCLVR